ncbi:hypothetical protein [Anaerotignum sp. MB30-C6]|uniref:hypothetical protein n=1 Tax=Anaerotignum sp. MB30-C6 TaxID=3070814 RepID=UPI0027DC9C28|nr:hypothetical protein [Anaerotignum sp. MB30-C6]WMI81946.1 hypothetical protein RBQ60_04230 [Anaerotignum sp. MB30-C6]
MNRFIKRNTVRELEILGNTYNVDFGNDEIPFIFQKVADESRNIAGEDDKTILENQKEIFKLAINIIIGNANASEQIFKYDNSAVLHSDVYKFLVDQFTEVMSEQSPYSPNRIK